MKKISSLSLVALVSGLVMVAIVSRADDKKPKPYPLNTCVVSDEKIGTDPSMKPYVFTHKGREVKTYGFMLGSAPIFSSETTQVFSG